MAGIDNLGGYGQFTSAAKAAGGVDRLISSLEKTAMSNAASGLRAQGAVLGVLGTCGLLGAVGGLRHWHNQRKQAKSATQEAARAELRDALNLTPDTLVCRVDVEGCEDVGGFGGELGLGGDGVAGDGDLDALEGFEGVDDLLDRGPGGVLEVAGDGQ